MKKIAFDKTGTLTCGTPKVVLVHSALPPSPITSSTASAPRRSAILSTRSARPSPAAVQLSQGCTVTYAAVDGVFAGFLALSDTIREESAGMIDQLSALQVQPVLLTGDHQNAAAAIAAQLHIGEVHANCLPEDKLAHIRAYQAADVGIAMGGVGSDIAVDAADIALVDDEVTELPQLIALSKRMMRTIKLNITFSLTLNFIAIVLAITGTLNPVVGAPVHNAGSVLVITNSALLLKWRQTASQSFASADAKSV